MYWMQNVSKYLSSNEGHNCYTLSYACQPIPGIFLVMCSACALHLPVCPLREVLYFFDLGVPPFSNLFSSSSSFFPLHCNTPSCLFSVPLVHHLPMLKSSFLVGDALVWLPATSVRFVRLLASSTSFHASCTLQSLSFTSYQYFACRSSCVCDFHCSCMDSACYSEAG